MEPDTVSTPKINRNTFSFGSGSLLKRVTNNERKITVLKNIIKSQNINIGEKITPTISTVQESLMATNEVLVDIAGQLEQDFQSRISEKQLLLKQSRSEKLGTRRQNFEERIEAKRTQKVVGTVASKTVKPLGGIFGAIKDFLLILGGGMLINALINFEKLNPGVIMENIGKVYGTIEKHMSYIIKLGTGFIDLKMAKTIAKIVAVGAGFMAILSSPLLFAGIGVIAAAALQGVGKGEKEVLEELENMGGFTQENRDKLIDKLKDQKSNLNPLQIIQGVGAEIDERIKFLETGQYGYGFGGPKTFDFTSIEKMKSLNNFEKLLLSIDDDSMNKIEFKELPVNDLRTEKKGTNINEAGGESATRVSAIPSGNTNNNYMKQTPSFLEFEDLVYT